MNVMTEKTNELLKSKLFLKYKKILSISVRTRDVISAEMIAKALGLFENELIGSETYNQRL